MRICILSAVVTLVACSSAFAGEKAGKPRAAQHPLAHGRGYLSEPGLLR